MADLFVLPTRYDILGLVINEAMANGLPVITTNKCIAGLELVKNGYNGYIVPVGDVKKTAERIKDCIADENNKLGENSLKIIADYTFEEMAKRHIEILNQK